MNKRKKRNRGAQQIPFSILSPFADSAYFPYTRKAPPKSDFQLGVFTPGTASPPNFNRGQKLGRTLLHGKACQRLTGLGIGVANCSTLGKVGSQGLIERNGLLHLMRLEEHEKDKLLTLYFLFYWKRDEIPSGQTPFRMPIRPLPQS
ncbi:hypothetical protein RDI58_023616 [Solanum bulbocastanum]|uniref:Uncharacterized protein n=1 Tax=Solanum bulbocastanum TaxID=147425 RepID=A0AAN8XW19_SOLBU